MQKDGKYVRSKEANLFRKFTKSRNNWFSLSEALNEINRKRIIPSQMRIVEGSAIQKHCYL